MSKIIKHIEIIKLGRPLLEGDVIRPKENIFGFTANRNYVLRRDGGITRLYIKNNYGKVSDLLDLDLGNWLVEQREETKTIDLKSGDIVTPKENFRCFSKGKQYLVMESTLGGNVPYIVNDVGVYFKVTDLEISRYFTKVNKEEKTNFLSDLKLGDKITPLVDMIDFTEGLEYEVKNSDMNPDILFIVSNSNKVISVSLLAPKLWSKVSGDIISAEENLEIKEEMRGGINPYSENPFTMPYTNSVNFIKEEFSGGSVNYYRVTIDKPLSDDLKPCIVEFEDIALALGLEPMEYNIMKELWRTANARTNGLRKKGHNTKYGREKVLHYAKLLHKLEEQ